MRYFGQGERSEPPGKRSAQRGEAERRREGYPPEGPRPRSGLGRVARSRSDAPRLIVAFGTPFTIFGIDCVTTGTVGGAGGTLSSPWATR